HGGWWNRDFESREEAIARAVRVARALRERDDAQARIALVSHGDFINFLLHALHDRTDGGDVYYTHDNGGITHGHVTPRGESRLQYLNRVDHLAGDRNAPRRFAGKVARA